MAIIDPEFADRLLRYIADQESGNSVDTSIAEALSVPVLKVRDHLVYALDAYPGLFRIQRYGYGNLRPLISRVEAEGIRYFLAHGGMQAVEEAKAADRQAPPVQHITIGNSGNIIQGQPGAQFSDLSLNSSRNTSSDARYSSTGTNTENGKGKNWASKNKEWIIAIVVLLLSIAAHMMGLL